MRKRARREAAAIRKFRHAQSCLHSQKRIRNNSVYCQYQDRGWISPKNCEGCNHYKPDSNVTPAAPEEGVDNTGSVRDEKGNAIDITTEDELEW